ncbi:tetracycline resistance ribosomal protection protein Otr(A) [Streptomyces hesseae]|uniref:Tetracycline resistance ribosomal protection protein Otr(A) n=1 Tax=Streptomyces hesseae TaxID=3075519 RepID=A0ABU2SGZ0_9ACTN|nr:tetracycline resistance ribosomal protection protein Otr(A) [Streptomyces sp. DSM 40473]MDT0448162.1 tetracycline resistance ribosomal protection protein Otr(A) [Streptomyces sp. DSM 40473]
MNKLNLGILAHVDAGKTSLTERLLHRTGVIDTVGSVDDGTTQTDSLELERRRGITIRSAVAAFVLDDLKVNLIDTPGHSDFIAEVERALRVLDGAVLVVSAVEGVQPQTRVLMRTLRRLAIPTLVFVNKADRAGADTDAVLAGIRRRLTGSAVAMTTVTDLGTPAVRVRPRTLDDPAFTDGLAEVLAGHSDAFLGSYLDDTLTSDDYTAELALQTAKGLTHPVYFGSAATGEGIDELLAGVRHLLPAPDDTRPGGEPAGTVFKIERGSRGERIGYLHLTAGSLAARDEAVLHRTDHAGHVTRHCGRITSLRVFERGATTVETRAEAGDIAQIRGLKDLRVGDRLGPADATGRTGVFAPPALETVVRPLRPEAAPRLHTALTALAEADPHIELQQDADTGGAVLRLYGEVQKDIIHTTLAEEFGVAVRFEETRTVHIEKPVGAGTALEEIDTRAYENYFWATVGLRVEPAGPGEGVVFRLGVELGSLPRAFHKAIEDTVHSTLRHGLYGWQVTDCLVTLTHTGYASPVSAADDFRKVTPLVLMDALRRAGTEVHEPVNAFELELPTGALSPVLARLAEVGATPFPPVADGDVYRLEGLLAAGRTHGFEQRVPGLTQGEGVFLSAFHGYRPVRGHQPVRPRPQGPDPLNRDAYLLHVLKRL